MNIFVPNYYQKFKCIADKCTHNCCIGWEIDIDEATMSYYDAIGGKIGQRLRQNISKETSPHFILQEGDRCPFLNENGLCEIISTLGEESICDICTDHPRFRSFFSDFTELGLGLCCEEAARIILNSEEPFSLVAMENDREAFVSEEEKYILDYRDKLFKLIQQRDITIHERMSKLASEIGLKLSDFSLEKLCSEYLSLERLDKAWTVVLEDLRGFEFDMQIFCDDRFQIPFEQLICYFLFRHLPEAIWDGDINSKVRFALSGCCLIGALCSRCEKVNGAVSIEQMAEFARMYSAEVEYSDENMKAVL